MTDADAVLVGGPRDGTSRRAEGNGLIEIEIDGMVHRYIVTTQRRGDPGGEKTVYTYDGMVNPRGAEDGVENAEARLASPLADEHHTHH